MRSFFLCLSLLLAASASAQKSGLVLRQAVRVSEIGPSDMLRGWARMVDESNQNRVKVAVGPVLLNLTADAVAGAVAAPGGGFSAGFVVEISLTASATNALATLTADHVNQMLAIVYNGRLLAAPVVQERIDGGVFILSGVWTEAEARDLASAIGSASDG